ncbi:MAG: GFA family protein [Pseudomonadota bacterium]|nr:MAG: aldehyde-activating protein [Pseudomonadota bacterium]
MSHLGSCHCGQVRFEVEGEFDSVVECNCTHCSRKGYLLWFVPRAQMKLVASPDPLPVYLFNKHAIRHHFCPNCGCAPFAFGENQGQEMAAINIRCLEDVDPATVKRIPFDGRSS